MNYSSYLCDMKSAKVLKILHVSRQTLVQYVKKKDIRVVKLPNGTYDYNDDDVYRKAGLAAERMNVVYSRVSTAKQKNDLDNQEKTLIDYCNKNRISNNLYNQALYLFRQQLDADGTWIWYNDMDKIMKLF